MEDVCLLMAIWSILRTCGIFYGHLVYFMDIWSILWKFGLLKAIWYILWAFGLFYGYLVYFMDIWYILWKCGIFSPCTKKNLADPGSKSLIKCGGIKFTSSRTPWGHSAYVSPGRSVKAEPRSFLDLFHYFWQRDRKSRVLEQSWDSKFGSQLVFPEGLCKMSRLRRSFIREVAI
jgi:hypothetical protein